MLKQGRKSKQKTPRSKSMLVKQCPLCWALFSTKSKHRRFCCVEHTKLWHQYHYLLKKKKEGRLQDWEVGLLERLHHYIEKERAVNLATIQTLQGYSDAQKERR
ncbi:hypothetical protein B0813_003144 [Candidatus Fervidibacteria bacterium JGI MDM2 SSWTFF-3-K9]